MLANMGVIRLLKTTPVEGVAPADFDEDVTRLRSEHYAKPDMYVPLSLPVRAAWLYCDAHVLARRYVAMLRELQCLPADFAALASLRSGWRTRFGGDAVLPPTFIVHHSPDAMVKHLYERGQSTGMTHQEAIDTQRRWRQLVRQVYVPGPAHGGTSTVVSVDATHAPGQQVHTGDATLVAHVISDAVRVAMAPSSA